MLADVAGDRDWKGIDLVWKVVLVAVGMAVVLMVVGMVEVEVLVEVDVVVVEEVGFMAVLL